MTTRSVPIPPEILEQVTDIARRRNATNRAAGQADGLVSKHTKSSTDADVEGALGEYAVAQAFSLPWDGAYYEHTDWQHWRNHGHDVSGIEVRATKYPNGKLIVQPNNNDDAPYVLVILKDDLTQADLRGWRWGRDVKLSCFWQSQWPRPTYAMPQSHLFAIDDLKAVWNATWWLSTDKMTFEVTITNGRVSDTAPVARTFIGQPFQNLVRWLRQQGGFTCRLNNTTKTD